MSYPSSLFSPLINAGPKRGFYSLLLYLLYLQIFFQNTSFALYSSCVLHILSLSFSTSLSSFFHSFNNTPSFLLPNSFATLLSPFFSLISSILTSFSLFFFPLLLPLYTPSIYPLSYPSSLISPLINTAPKRGFYSLLLYLLYLPINFQNTSFALYSSRLLFIPSFSFSTSLSSYFYPILFPFSLSFPTSLSPFYPLIYSILTLFFFSTSLPSLYYSISSQWLLPCFLISSLINAAPKRRFSTLLLSLLYLQIFSQKTSIALYSSRLLFILSSSFSTSLFSYFDSFLISPSFLFSRSFATSPFPFPSLISSISSLFSLFFFSGFPTSISLISPLFSLFFFSGFPTSISSYLSIKRIYGCSVRMIPFVMTWDGVVTTHHRRHIVVLRKTLGSMLASQGRTRTEVS